MGTHFWYVGERLSSCLGGSRHCEKWSVGGEG